MAWTIELNSKAARELERVGTAAQRNIIDYLKNRIAPSIDAHDYGTALIGNYRGLWRYRVGDYRIICRILEDTRVVQVLRVGHRREVYD